jgi:O-antigen ligase
MILEIVVFIEPAPVDALLMVILAGALLFGKLDFRAMGPMPAAFIGLFAFMNLASLYDIFDPAHGTAYVAVTLYLAASWMLFAGLIGRYGKPLMMTLIAAYCVAGLISSLLGVAGYFHLVPFWKQLLLNGRARGLFKDCNVYGPFFVPMAMFAFPGLMDSRSPVRTRLWNAAIFAAAVLAIVLCFSRACWLNFAVALAVFFAGQLMMQPRSQRVRGLTRIAGIVVVGGIGLIILLNVPAVHSMLEVRMNSDRLQGYDRIRFATQSLALQAAETHVFGIGPGQSEAVFDYSTHSMYLRILAENGVLALAALLGFIGATMARCVTLMRRAVDPRIREISLAVFATIAGHLVNSFVIDTVHWRHIWFIYALPWVSAPLYRRLRAVPVPRRLAGKYRPAQAPAFARV